MTNYLASKITEAIETPILPRVRKPSFSNYPSSASAITDDGIVVGSCLRDQFYNKIGAPSDDTRSADVQLSILLGDVYCNGLVDILKNISVSSGITPIAAEYPFYNKNGDVSGRIDIVAMDNSTGELIVIEVKSVGDWKSKQVLLNPDIQHVLQAALYLDYFKTSINLKDKKPKKAYVLYIARSENWDLKGKKHYSPLTAIWDYTVYIENNYIKYDTPTSKVDTRIKIDTIYDRYNMLTKHLKENTLPDADFEIQYSEEKLVTLFKQNKIQYKKDQKVIEKWLDKGAKKGELNLDMGDSQCRFCGYKEACIKNIIPPSEDIELIYNFPKKPKSIVKETKNFIL
jgi:hypothetical protein